LTPRSTGRAFVVALALVSGVTGCSSGDDAVDWANGFCGALVDLSEATGAPPAVDLNDPAVAKPALVEWLGNATVALEKAETDLRALGDAPDEVGEQAVSSMTEAFGEMRQAMTDAKAIAETADATDPVAFAAEYGKITERMSVLAQDPLADVKGSTEIVAASQKAQNCQVAP
jgi:hypothetical protein